MYPILLNVTVHHHVEMYIDSIPAVAEKLLQSIYVDDMICGANEEDEAWRLYFDSRGCLVREGSTFASIKLMESIEKVPIERIQKV